LERSVWTPSENEKKKKKKFSQEIPLKVSISLASTVLVFNRKKGSLTF